MHDESLSAISAEIDGQNAEFQDALNALAGMGESELEVPHAFLETLDSLSAPPLRTDVTPINGLRA